MLEFTTDLVIVAPPTEGARRLLRCEGARRLVAGQARRCACRRPLGSYAVEWEPTEWRDEHAWPARRGASRDGDGVQARARILPGRHLLAAAGRRSHRSDGARGHLQPSHVGHAAARPAIRVRRRRAVAEVLRVDWARMAPRARIAEEVRRARADQRARSYRAVRSVAASGSSTGPCARSGEMLTDDDHRRRRHERAARRSVSPMRRTSPATSVAEIAHKRHDTPDKRQPPRDIARLSVAA